MCLEKRAVMDPISEVNFRFGWKSFSLLRNGSCDVPDLNTQKMSST